jgi:hypothetical protein
MVGRAIQLLVQYHCGGGTLMLCDDSQCLPKCPTPAAQLLMVILFDVKFERGMLIGS